MGKAIGIILAIVGAIVLALSFEQVRTQVSLTLPSGIKELYLMIAGVVILLLGALMMKGTGGGARAGSEIPIYKGNQIIGYRKV